MNTRTRELITRLGCTQQPASEAEVAELRARLAALPRRPSRGVRVPLPMSLALVR